MENQTQSAPAIDPNQKAMLLQAVAQLEMFSQAFNNAPERVQKANIEFVEALKEWANG